MEVKSIIRKCLETIGAEDFTLSQELNDEQQTLLNRLMSGLNLTYLEICSDILPITGEEKATVKDGIIDLAQFSERVTKIKKISNVLRILSKIVSYLQDKRASVRHEMFF